MIIHVIQEVTGSSLSNIAAHYSISSEISLICTIEQARREMFLCNDALNTFYLRLNGVGHGK